MVTKYTYRWKKISHTPQVRCEVAHPLLQRFEAVRVVRSN